MIEPTGSILLKATCLLLGRCNSAFGRGSGNGSANSMSSISKMVSSGNTGPEYPLAETNGTFKTNVKQTAQKAESNKGGEKRVAISTAIILVENHFLESSSIGYIGME